MLDKNPELCSRVSFTVKPKGHNDKVRMTKLLSYGGPDLDTINLVDKHAYQWLEFPYAFWQGTHRRMPSPQGLLEPQAEIISAYLSAIRDDA